MLLVGRTTTELFIRTRSRTDDGHDKRENETETRERDRNERTTEPARCLPVEAPNNIIEDWTAALFMIEPAKNHVEQILIDDHSEKPAIVSEDGRLEKPSPDARKSFSTSIAPSRPSFKLYRCPHCFYRTNWHTDRSQHIQTRHSIEPITNVNYEMPPEEAERTYDDYERMYGYILSKEVLNRLIEFLRWNGKS